MLGRQWEDLHGSMTDVNVTGGYLQGDRATVLFEGRSKRVDHLYGEALLHLEDGQWRLRDELVSVGARTP